MVDISDTSSWSRAEGQQKMVKAMYHLSEEGSLPQASKTRRRKPGHPQTGKMTKIEKKC